LEGDAGNDCLVTVDGTDFHIPEYGPTFFSHKFKSSGLRYEVGVSILNGKVVWTNGPYECGKWNDITIFRNAMLSMLGPNEQAEADDGYVGESPLHIKCPKCFTNPKEKLAMQGQVRSRHETVNKRFKQWGCLLQRFRHEITRHAEVFRAVAVITELAIENGEPLFEVNYSDDQHTSSTTIGDDELSL
jgi:hypothetical protein